MKLYNTLTRKIEEFIPNKPNKVKIYTCGPTVYHYAHIGNLRSYVMEDVLEKSLEYLGYEVERVMNITDVGHLSGDSDDGTDKMISGAKREKKSVLEIAKYYTDAFFEDFKKLNIRKPKTVIPATDCILEYIKMIETLLEKKYAYISGHNVYFDTSKLDKYYVLTNQTEEDLKIAVRDDVEEDKNKKNKNDFVLWFTKSKFEDQELKWDSPWGYGYPGWHIECSGISLKYLGEYLDIHCGGVDNAFPHHTNEIAQTESCIGHKWCNYWFHIEHLNDINGKMSKSKGDFLTVTLLESKGYNPLVYRLFCLQSHYRKQLVFSYDALNLTVNAYDKIINKIKMIKENKTGDIDNDTLDLYKNRFKEAISNDLNTSLMVTCLHDILKEDTTNNTKLEVIKLYDTVLSLRLLEEVEAQIPESLKKYIEDKIEARKQAKLNKDFEKADLIRKELEDKNIIIKDTREGTTYEVK